MILIQGPFKILLSSRILLSRAKSCQYFAEFRTAFLFLREIKFNNYTKACFLALSSRDKSHLIIFHFTE